MIVKIIKEIACSYGKGNIKNSKSQMQKSFKVDTEDIDANSFFSQCVTDIYDFQYHFQELNKWTESQSWTDLIQNENTYGNQNNK